MKIVLASLFMLLAIRPDMISAAPAGYRMYFGPGELRGVLPQRRLNGSGYGFEYKFPVEFLDRGQARDLVNEYLFRIGAKNFSAGRIVDLGNVFLVEIRQKDKKTVDEIVIDKKTRWMQSAPE